MTPTLTTLKARVDEAEEGSRYTFYEGADEHALSAWRVDWRKDMAAWRFVGLQCVTAEMVQVEAERLIGNLRACMRDAEPCNDFSVHWSWPWPVVKILAQRKLIVPDGKDWARTLTGYGWAVRVHMQGDEPWGHRMPGEKVHRTWVEWPLAALIAKEQA